MRNLRAVRKSKRMSLRDLSRVMDVDHSTISYWEHGKRNPNKESMEKLERYFRKPAEYLMATSGTEEQDN